MLRKIQRRHQILSFLALSLMLLDTTTAAQGQSSLAVDESTIVTDSDNYRSTEHISNNSQQIGVDPVNSFTSDPAFELLGDDLRHRIWFDDPAWITDVGTLLYRDDDNDGYFSGFSLTIDADTHYTRADVYLSIDVQGPFNQRERLHKSAIFPIYGTNFSDEYRIDIDLIKNYSASHYDLFVELRDAYDHRVLDSVNAADFSNLYGLPLESEYLDLGFHDEHPVGGYPHPHAPNAYVNDDIRVVEYTGSAGIVLLMLIAVILLVRFSPSMHTKVR